MPFITAKEGPPNVGSNIYTVQYFDENGNMVIRSDGSKAWRNSNPGNMVYPNKLIKHLSIEEFERLRTAIERIEGWKEGHEDFIPKWIISGVHKKRSVITEYLVCINQESIWLPKQEAIKWTLEGKLHAILVHMKNGNHYLRPEHGQHSFVAIT